MRVPSIGLPADERRIVRESLRMAEYLLRDYHDKPSFMERAGNLLATLGLRLQARD